MEQLSYNYCALAGAYTAKCSRVNSFQETAMKPWKPAVLLVQCAGAVCGAWMPGVVCAQSQSGHALVEHSTRAPQRPVAIEKEPRHRLKFENQYVRIFDVLIVPGDTTLFHTHLNDGIGIKLTNARIVQQAYGGKWQESVVKRGEVGFSYYATPLIHRVSNVGSTPFRNMFIEVLPSSRSARAIAPDKKTPWRTLVLDNERVWIFRLVLEPGKLIEADTLSPRSVLVVISNAKVVIDGQRKNLKPGDFEWHDGHTKYSLRNAGSSPFEAVEIELR
jgi:mannose-6-phosphate isomerase-like protein (cupin superfamily)